MSEQQEPVNPDEEISEVIEISESVQLTAVERAAIDSQVATARAYPRVISACLKEAKSLATFDEETAQSMFYSVPRAKKMIEGPSARLAEVMMYAWGNFRADADVVAVDATFVTAVGTAFDVEKNVAARIRVKRRITDKRGKTLNEDMIGVISQAAISIALRNAVFKVIPRSIVDRIYRDARAAAVGDIATLSAKRDKSIAWFNKAGISTMQLLEKLEVKGVEDIGEEEYLTLLGLFNAVKGGEITLDSIFLGATEQSQGSVKLNAELERKKQERAAASGAAQTETAKPKAKACPICSRIDGTHDPKASCGKKAAEDADLAADRDLANAEKK